MLARAHEASSAQASSSAAVTGQQSGDLGLRLKIFDGACPVPGDVSFGYAFPKKRKEKKKKVWKCSGETLFHI